MNSRPDEISSIIKQQIKEYESHVEMSETGTVVLVGDGIAKAQGSAARDVSFRFP